MIKAGEVAFLKTTGEAVFILGFYADGPGSDKDYVKVRRPIAGQDGIKHTIEQFQLNELESLEEQQARFVAERQKVMDKYGPKGDAPGVEDAGFPIN